MQVFVPYFISYITYSFVNGDRSFSTIQIPQIEFYFLLKNRRQLLWFFIIRLNISALTMAFLSVVSLEVTCRFEELVVAIYKVAIKITTRMSTT